MKLWLMWVWKTLTAPFARQNAEAFVNDHAEDVQALYPEPEARQNVQHLYKNR